MTALHHIHALPAGYRLHWYTIERLLGQGGFGITYLATDTNLEQQVAMKEYLPAELAARTQRNRVEPLSESHDGTYRWGLDRFIAEGRTLAKFHHPNIVRVQNIFEANNTAYMVMSYVGEESLEDACGARRFKDEEEIRNLLIPLLDAVQTIHAQGFIHRDIKPENIHIDARGQPVLLDFGSARQALGAKTRTLTALVTPGYAPFEQYAASRDADKQGPWTDIYAVGATLYRCVSGKAPKDAMRRVQAALTREQILAPASELAAGFYSEELLNAIDWALEILPERRPQNVGEWRGAFVRATSLEGIDPGFGPSTEVPGARVTSDTLLEAQSAGTAPSTRADFPSEIDTSTQSPPARRRVSWVRVSILAVLLVAGGASVWFQKHEELDQAAERTELRRLEEERAQLAVVMRQKEEQAARVVERQHQVNKAVEDAETILRKTPFAIPDGEHALGLYRKVLRLEPGNAEATQGIDRVAEALLERARTAIDGQDFQSASRFIHAANRALPGGDSVRGMVAFYNDAKQTLAESRAREARIERLLAAARRDIDDLRLTRPSGNNAAERLKTVLATDPENAQAKSMQEEITARYVRLARQTIVARNFSKARDYLASAELVISDSEAVVAAREALANEIAAEADRELRAKRAQLAMLMEEGAAHLAAFRKHRAIRSYEAAVELFPDEPAVRRALAHARSSFGIGEQFNDTLADGTKGPQMMVVPAGSFRMGGNQKHEGPVHKVIIARPLAVGVFEITEGEFNKFSREDRDQTPDTAWSPNHPVQVRSWDVAVAYVEWLSTQTGKTYRLPSEAEWEYAARGGTQTEYWWGDEVDPATVKCWGCQAPAYIIDPVGSFKPNPFGLYDTSSSVAEWTQDCWVDSYTGAPNNGTARTAVGCQQRVIRGGSMFQSAINLRSAARAPRNRSSGFSGAGIRVVRDL